jgi:23S rRNA (guanine2445-N2)-methyltransferase / 23S rRNA (guanine2069-N7)-methyltransferase
LYNGRIECQYYQFHGPRPPKLSRSGDLRQPDRTAGPSEPPVAPADTPPTAEPQPVAPPAFGGLDAQAERQAQEFRNRLAKRARHLRRWTARGISCYRLYERDIPDVPLVVDRYGDRLHMAEFARPHTRTPAQHADWLDLMKRTAADVMGVHPSHVFMKYRDRQRGTSQYERRGSTGNSLVVREGGLQFHVNLSDYVDTGLFLDHRITRQMVRKLAEDRRVLNLFGYTGTFTVYAAAGGARQTTTVDLSRTYLQWARKNLELNGFAGPQHRYTQSDALQYVRDLHPDVKFDLAVVDPPTFSNSKRSVRDWETQRDHVELLQSLLPHMTPGSTVFFSTNFRRFRLQDEALQAACHQPLAIREISHQTVPPDFRNRRIHRCWRILVAG